MSQADTRRQIDRRLAEPLAESRESGDAIGFVGPDVPVQVLLATRRPFGHLPWRVSGATPWADRWLESSFPFWARSILEQWHDGCFDCVGNVVFSRSEDASQRLYYYVAELRRRGKLAGPEPITFDIAHVPRESSLLHTEAAITELMRALDVSRDELGEGIARANRLHARLGELARQRAADGPFWERLGRAALWSDPTRWLERAEPPPSQAPRPRVLLAGSVPADDRLHAMVERAGASIIAEDHALALLRQRPELTSDAGNAELELARHLRSHSVAPRAFRDRPAWVVERARGAQADAVVLWLTREDEGLAWTVPAQRRALAAAGIPVLVLAAARWQADDETGSQITAFLEECARATA